LTGKRRISGISARSFGPTSAAARSNASTISASVASRSATEVHHLTYVRVFNELATDLLPVCSTCHRNIHHLKPANDNSPNDNQLALPFPITDDG
jgi:hypothetical protein